MNLVKRIIQGGAALAIAAAIWLPCVHFLFARNINEFRATTGLSPKAQGLAAQHLQFWNSPALKEHELAKMRASNAEWDFMGRTFLVWSLAEMSLRNPVAKSNYLPVMDQIIQETMILEKERGMYFFLMPYARSQPFVMQPARSHFLDSEIAMMLAERRLVEEKPEYKVSLRGLTDAMAERMERGTVLSAESYPDECWMFDNVAALAAMRMEDKLDGTDHSDLIHRWVAMAKQKLVDPKSGILISSYTVQGMQLSGPKGSSIWMGAHMLRLADEDFARDQYQRARKEMGRQLAGFSWSSEWPQARREPVDIDSGPVIPVLDVSAGASGMAFIGASSFGDADYLQSLATTLDFAAFPSRTEGRLRYCAGNQVGDAVLLYASVLGPLWEKVERN